MSFSINRLSNQLWCVAFNNLFSFDVNDRSANSGEPILRSGNGQQELGSVNVPALGNPYGGGGAIRFDNFGNLYCTILLPNSDPPVSIIRRISTNSLI